MNVRPNGLDDEPMYALDIDWEKAQALGVTATDINDTLQDAYGSSYIDQFIENGRVKKVYLQGAAKARMLPDQLGDWYVRNASGGMVPFTAFATGYWTYGSPKLERYNGQSSIEILGQPAPGYSTGQVMQEMEKLATELPPGFGYQWTGLSYEQQRSGSQTPILYAISILVVFLALTALYESWSIPLSVMLVVPLGVIGAIVFTQLRGMNDDVFLQVGLLTTVGLAVKNAILIVEFAVQNVKAGMDLIEATVAAARQRLRPILMTSLAFMLGVLPLAIATGAVSGGRTAIGTGVLGGMFSATVLAIFLVPAFFVGVHRMVMRQQRKAAPAEPLLPPPSGASAASPRQREH
jgi:multidrug efflux pump